MPWLDIRVVISGCLMGFEEKQLVPQVVVLGGSQGTRHALAIPSIFTGGSLGDGVPVSPPKNLILITPSAAHWVWGGRERKFSCDVPSRSSHGERHSWCSQESPQIGGMLRKAV